MTEQPETELDATIRRMETAQRRIEQHAPEGTDLSATYEELDEAIRDYEAAVPRWREQQAQR